MKIKDKIKIGIKGKDNNFDIKQIVNDLPDNNIIAKYTLEKLNNKTTKIVFDNDIKGNYYVFLNDTIYLSNKDADKYKRLTVICHECVHSIQNKALQLINFIFSNLEVIIFVIFAILKLLNKFTNTLTWTYLTVVIISLIPRFILEIHASLKSITLTKEYVNEKVGKNEAEFVHKIVKFQVISLLPIMLFSLIFWKIIRTLVIYII